MAAKPRIFWALAVYLAAGLGLAQPLPQARAADAMAAAQGAPVWSAHTASADGDWVQLIPGGDPRYGIMRIFAPAIYDPIGDRLVTFGARDPYDWTNETWALSLSGSPAWSELLPAGDLPEPRIRHSVIYDSKRNRLVTFGGVSYDAVSLDDVWALSLSGPPAWSQPTLTTGPLGRQYHAAIYDRLRDRMVICGGSIGGNPIYDVWALSFSEPATWTRITAFGASPTSVLGQWWAYYDAPHDQMVVFTCRQSGTYPYFTVFNDVWALSFSGAPHWSKITELGTPPDPPSPNHPVMHDAVRDRMIVTSGSYQSNATWVFEFSDATTGTWRKLSTGGVAPIARDYPSAIYDSGHDRMVFFGGEDHTSHYPLDVNALTWTPEAVAVDAAPAFASLRWEAVTPNPSTGQVQLSLQVAHGGEGLIEVFDLSGRRVARLASAPIEVGRRLLTWNGRDETGRAVKPGLYLARATVAGEHADARIVIVH